MKRFIILTTLLILASVAGFAQVSDLETVAIVNLTRTEPITVGQLKADIRRFESASGRTLSTVDERREILNTMINERLVLQAAARDRVTVTENEINQQIQQLRNVLAQQLDGRQPTEAEFAQAVRNEYNMEVAAFRTQLQRTLLMQKYLISKKESVLNSFTIPTEQEIVEHYNLVKTQLVRPETARFHMIMVPFGPDAASKTNARQIADRISRDIANDPSKFDDMAARSISPNSEYRAGDSGYIPRNPEARAAFGQNLLNAAFTTRQGQVSPVIEGLQGYCIIKVTENHGQRNLELDDIIQFGTTVTVRNYIGQGLLNERQQSALQRASEELVTELRAGNPFRIFENFLNW